VILDIRTVANALGGEVISGNQVLAPTPGHSARDRSLSVTLSNRNPDGFIAHSHTNGDDDWRAIRDYVKERLGIPLGPKDREAAPTTRPVREGAAGRGSDDRAAAGLTTTTDAMKLCRGSVDPRGTLVERYLNVERNLDLPTDLCGEVLRWHPGIQAMLAVFRNILTGQPQAVSRTFLTSDAKKIGNAKFTGPVKGAAIMLDPFENVLGGLHIGAGVETVMTARQWRNFKPAWALGSDGAIEKFPVLDGIEALTLIQENDENGSSQRACRACALCWDAAGREVFIDVPKSGFKDINDVIRGKSAS
jgi:putative DNA primase/helicase